MISFLRFCTLMYFVLLFLSPATAKHHSHVGGGELSKKHVIKQAPNSDHSIGTHLINSYLQCLHECSIDILRKSCAMQDRKWLDPGNNEITLYKGHYLRFPFHLQKSKKPRWQRYISAISVYALTGRYRL